MGIPTDVSSPDVKVRTQIGRRRASANRGLRSLPTLAVTLSLVVTMAIPAHAADVLILSPSVQAGMNSFEYKIVTSTGPIAGLGVSGLGLSADLVPTPGPGTWPTPPQPYSSYKAIILGDPGCSSPTVPLATATAPVAAAVANATAWAAAVTGNVVIIGTDAGTHTAGAQLYHSAIGWAVAGFNAGDGTGAVIALSCYYDYGRAPSPTQVPVLNGFGTFMARQTTGLGCSNAITVVASSPALTLPLGPSAILSGWGCSVHEGFTSWPSAFKPLAVATDAALLSNLPPSAIVTAADGTKGFPYILARGKTLVPVAGGILKVCKVAGLGVPVGMSFNFMAGSTPFAVPAGPAPGGYCTIVGTNFPVGSSVTVAETIPPGHVVSSIVVAPASQLVPGSLSLPAGSVAVTIGPGVTEITFTDKRTGFVEICKRGHVTGNFTFTVNPGGLGPFVVPAGACSPAIEVAAGTVFISETLVPGTPLIGCATIPLSTSQLACNSPPQVSTVNVAPGNISTMTIAFVTNGHVFPSDASLPGHSHSLATTTTSLTCTPNPAPATRAVVCTAKVAAVEPKTGSPTGSVKFAEGSATLSTVQLSSDGTAAFTTSGLAAGAHAITASYDGDPNFDQSTSPPFNVTVAQP